MVWFRNIEAARLIDALESLQASATNTNHRIHQIMATLEDIQAEADQIRDGVTTLISKVNDEATKIADLTAQLAAAGGDKDKVDAISAELTTTVAALQAATAEATPPEPTA